MMRRVPLLTLLTISLALALSAPALAAPSLQVGIADDGVTQRTPALAPEVIPQWRSKGADVARLLVIWAYVAPDSERMTRPSGFDPADPNAPGYNWAPIDQAVSLLRQNGIEPILNLTGWAPLWGTKDPSLRDQRLNPDPKQFATFAEAAAKRYGAQVDRYILWNEPNYPLWLKPQFSCKKGRCTAASPHQYRTIARSAVPAIKAGDPGARVYGPAIASAGKPGTATNKEMRPLEFLRGLGCVGKSLKATRSGPCKGSKPASLDGIAYHPHSRTLAPDKGYPNHDEANLADYGRLTRTIDAAQRTGGLLNGTSKTKKFDLFYDEWGYQTNPPDPIAGVSYTRQSDYLQWGSYLAYKQPRVKMLIQYLWRDDPLGVGTASKYAGWQSGLYSFDGRPKTSARTWPHPFWVDLPRGKRSASVWGQVRPGAGASKVTVQRRLAGSSSYTTLKTLTTNAQGYFLLKTTVNAKATFRFRYVGADGATVTSTSRTVQPKG